MSSSQTPKPPPEDDRALARMLGCALLLGVAVIWALAWLFWHLM